MKIPQTVILSLLIISLIMLTACSSEETNCEEYTEIECMNHEDVCALCGETMISSYASCHSIEFCQSIPFE